MHPVTHFWLAHKEKHQTCRNVPGNAGYPKAAAWSKLNATIGGRLVNVVPTANIAPAYLVAHAPARNGLAPFQGVDAQNNWEQVTTLHSFSMSPQCNDMRSRGCPIFSVEAQNAADIQAAVKFAKRNSLRLVVKCSGHDVLGRSTAPYSLLIRTAGLQNISMADAFFVGTQNMGLRRTGRSWWPPQRQQFVRRVCAGSRPLSSFAAFGLAADNVLGEARSFGLEFTNRACFPSFRYLTVEFHIIVASGELLQVNSISHPDLFYALRGGGSGSWGVILSATFRTFPTFDEAFSVIQIAASSNAAMGALATVHAQHISTSSPSSRTSPTRRQRRLQRSSRRSGTRLGATRCIAVAEEYVVKNVNDALFTADDAAGNNMVVGSRLIPLIASFVIAGGQSPPTPISSRPYIQPGGRQDPRRQIFSPSASGLTLSDGTYRQCYRQFWTDQTPLAEIDVLRRNFQTPSCRSWSSYRGNGAAYSNEADVNEPQFQTTFFGPNYAELTRIKAK
ncbi:hypothetical protein B0H13DRAFT_2350974 [Mycena leptocephala]|nr:hypothetical protein B0H13DRAFT_2350974 [Mycena leptocephala]